MLQAQRRAEFRDDAGREAQRTTVLARLQRAIRPSGPDSPLLRRLGWVLLVLAAAFPLFGGAFYTRLAIEALLLGSVALSVDILLGYAGLLSLGQAAYFGLAAYIAALMYLHVTSSFWLVLVTVCVSVGIFSFLLGAVAIRAKGVYFALITFGAAEILSKITHNTRAIGGSDGLIGIPIPTIPLVPGFEIGLTDNLVFYYIVLGAICVMYVGTRRILSTGFGNVLRAIRDNSDRVPYLGYNPFWYKLLAYVLAAQIAAFGGLIYPMLRGFVAPHLFGFEVSTKAVVMSLVGGVGNADRAADGQRDHHVSGIRGRQLYGAAPARAGHHLHRLRAVSARRIVRSSAANVRAQGRVMIRVSDLNKAFGALRAVHELSFQAERHRITSIIGPNGAGKSTAFNLIAGTIRPDSGLVELDEHDVTGQPSYKLARLGVARSFQITNLFFGLSVFENVTARMSESRAPRPLSRPAGSFGRSRATRLRDTRGIRARRPGGRARAQSLPR